jgi:sterol desaturase/sphingolipid hydroxylase (fatty acid hydroxylase superfamily)
MRHAGQRAISGRQMNFSATASFFVEHPASIQCFLFGLFFSILWFCELRVAEFSALEKAKHTWINLLLLAGVLPVQLCMMVICIAAATFATSHHWGLLYLLPFAQSPWVKYGFIFLVLDLLDYVYHYTAHNFRPLWVLHLVHHTDQNVDVSTTFREHPGETFFRVCFLTAWVLICGASVEVLVLRQMAETLANVSQHMTFQLPPRAQRILGWLFVTPNLHHVHHHFRRPGTNCNYGDVLSIWDRLFGTYVELPRHETVFGLDTHLYAEPRHAHQEVLALLRLEQVSLSPAIAALP